MSERLNFLGRRILTARTNGQRVKSALTGGQSEGCASCGRELAFSTDGNGSVFAVCEECKHVEPIVRLHSA